MGQTQTRFKSREPSQARPLIGQTVLGAFKILELLGEGGFAKAYLAKQLGTERRAVVKIAHPHLIAEHGDIIRQYFANELRASTRVKHPNLVTVYTAGSTRDGLPAIAMEYVDGLTLETLLKTRAPLPPSMMSAVFGQLLSAIKALHQVGVMHCDLSPDNIVVQLNADGPRATVLDFGIAQFDDARSRTGWVLGTPGYTANEQIKGSPRLASDLFSLGAMMWWAVTGREFLEGAPTLQQAFFMQPEVPAIPRTVHGREVPESIAQLLRRLLEPDWRRRVSAEAVLNLWDDLMRAYATFARPRAARPAKPRRQATRSPLTHSEVRPRSNAPSRVLDLLIVCDEPEEWDLLEKYLHERCAATFSSTLASTLSTLERHAFDAVVIASGHRGIGSYLMVKQLRARWATVQGNPMLCMIADDNDATDRWKQAGADLRLEKTWQLRALTQQLSITFASIRAFQTLDHATFRDAFIHDQHQLRDDINAFIGWTPEALMTLDDRIAADEPTEATCAQLSAVCRAVGASHMERLVTMICRLSAPDFREQRRGLLGELETQYAAAVQELHRFRKAHK